MNMTRVVAIAALSLIAACSNGEVAANESTSGGEAREPTRATASFGQQIDENLLVGAQPTVTQLKAVAKAGYRTVITLRTPGEVGGRGEKEIVEELGMRFVAIPISGADDLTVENAKALAIELSAVDAPPVLLHCGSSNRVGALLGLKEFAVDGADPATAMALAKKAGITKLEPALRDVIKQLCQADVERDCSGTE